MTDRRTYFFLGAAGAVFLIEPLVPQYRWAIFLVTVIYLAFAVLFASASISANRTARRNGHL